MRTNKQTILCVDDDTGIHKLLQAQLESNDYASHHVLSGDQAIRILAKHHVDLIILDTNMPGMDGFTTLSHLKGMAETEHIPVIFLSAHHQEEIKIKGVEYGADDLFSVKDSAPENTPDAKRIPIDSLILSTAVEIDKIEEKIRESISASLLELNANSGDFPDISGLKDDFPLSPQQLSCKMPDEIIDNVEQIVKAFKNKILIAIDCPPSVFSFQQNKIVILTSYIDLTILSPFDQPQIQTQVSEERNSDISHVIFLQTLEPALVI